MVQMKISKSQLQPWSTRSTPPFIDRVVVPQSILPGHYDGRLSLGYSTSKAYAWSPILGYENVECMPLPSNPVINALYNPCYSPHGMSTEAIKFPNLVTGTERNPIQAAKTALYTRYTPFEWSQYNLSQFNESDLGRNYSEKLRSDAVRLMRETDEITFDDQRESGKKIGERLTETAFWHNELNSELARLIDEADALNGAIRAIQKTIEDIEGPLHIAQECLYHREQRQDIDLVHDDVEKSLLKEIQLMKNNLEILNSLLQSAKNQQHNNRAIQHELESDVRSKEGALNIDEKCFYLNNFSSGINYYKGVEKYDNTISNMKSWIENSNRRVQKSLNERSKSQQLRSDIDNAISQCAHQVWINWTNTNTSLSRRISECMDAKNKLEQHLQKLQQEIFCVEKNIELLRKALNDKTNPLKVAQTRLEIRSHRIGIENSRDNAQDRLIHEVQDINMSIDALHRKLQENELQLQQLLKTKNIIEQNLQFKVNSLFIDREKCLGMRRAYPITTTIKY